MPTDRICMSMILLEPAYKILHTTGEVQAADHLSIPVFRELRSSPHAKPLIRLTVDTRVINSESTQKCQQGVVGNRFLHCGNEVYFWADSWAACATPCRAPR